MSSTLPNADIEVYEIFTSYKRKVDALTICRQRSAAAGLSTPLEVTKRPERQVDAG